MKRMKIAVLGTQASGKGTQSHILSVLMGVPTASVGDLLRELQNEDSTRGHSAKVEMAKGAFVDDDIIMPLVKGWVDAHHDGWILDGFPRSVEQAKKCESFFKPDAVLYLEVPDEDSKRRISYRRICSKCKTNYNLITQPPHSPNGTCDTCGGELVKRADDTPELVEERLKHYHEVTEPLKEWFAARGKLVLIDARKGIAEVAHDAEVKLVDLLHRRQRARRFKVWSIVLLAAVVVTLVGITMTGYILNS
ncbi:MAG: nucleoside monophosphate kinase [Patescibacteria group bacterium]|jgi:adenylate kinase